MSGYYINIHVKADSPAPVQEAVTALFSEHGFQAVGEEAAAVVVEDEDKLPDGEGWYGVVVSGSTLTEWTSVYVEDWQDSGVLAKGLSKALAAPVLEVWIAEDTHWGYTYYENGIVLDRFADDPAKVAETAAEAAGLVGHAETLAAILRVPPAQFDGVLRAAQAASASEEFVGTSIDGLAEATGLPFEHIMIGYESFFEDDPDDYASSLEHWPQWRHLAFRHPAGKEQIAE